MLDPVNKVDSRLDVLIADGVVARIGQNLDAGEGARIIEAEGQVVAPGFVDMHVHLREPGRADEETVESGCLAAVAGGSPQSQPCPIPTLSPIIRPR